MYVGSWPSPEYIVTMDGSYEFFSFGNYPLESILSQDNLSLEIFSCYYLLPELASCFVSAMLLVHNFFK
jgi:hypothetical protein